MTSSSLQELAKKGNPSLIAALLNRSLQSQGVVAKAALKGTDLHVLLESALVPDQRTLVSRIRKGMTALGGGSFKTVILYGRQLGAREPSWTEVIELKSQPEVTLSDTAWSLSPPQSTMLTTHQIEEVIRTRSRLDASYFNHIPNLAKVLFNFLVPHEAIIDVLGVWYQGKLAALLLTNQRLACFSFLKQDVQTCFISPLNEIIRIAVSDQALKVYDHSTEEIVYFKDKRLAKTFVSRHLSKVVPIDEREKIPVSRHDVTLVILIGLILFAIFLVVILLYSL